MEPFELGRRYSRQALHADFGGQEQGGISTPSDQPFLLLFTGQSGAQYGYHDGWNDDQDVYLFTGEGQRGDMEFVRGNAAIRNHAIDGKALYLFQTLGKGRPVRYMGQFACASWEYRQGADLDGNNRRIIVFHLVPVESETVDESAPEATPIEDLKTAAYQAAQSDIEGEISGSLRIYYKRAKAVRDYVLARAGGYCECCKLPAPFARADGTPYLEPHHTKMVSEGGPDHPKWVGAVCPTCHRRIHHGADGATCNERLIAELHILEPD